MSAAVVPDARCVGPSPDSNSRPRFIACGIGQDVREEDRGVEPETCERLQRHLAGELGCRAERKKAPGAFARRAVLGQIATRLPHHPDRRPGRRLAQQRAQQQVVRERGAHAVGRPKTPAIVSWIDSAAARGSAASRIGRPTTM